MKLILPPAISELAKARNKLREHYASSRLAFTLDGNLIGDIGEALAEEYFGIKLAPPNDTGVDGYTIDEKSVQVKATGKNRGPAFRDVQKRAEHLLFIALNFETCTADVIFNGPEEIIREMLPDQWANQRVIPFAKMQAADGKVQDHQRLRPIKYKIS